MGFFAKLFGLQRRCPSCGVGWAKETFFSGVKCVSPSCRHYDRTYAAKVFKNPITAPCPACGADWAELASFSDVRCVSLDCRHYDAAYASGEFKIQRRKARMGRDPATGGPIRIPATKDLKLRNPITIEYVNFRGEQKKFTCHADSMRIRGAHLSVRVAPTGWRIALKFDRIVNRDSVEQQVAEIASKVPTPREKRVLRYHQKHGTTSPLYESLRAKYPDS